MTFKFIILLFAIVFVTLFSIGSLPEPSNPPTANTGAPGETACMLSGCHSGGSYTGTVEITGVPDTVFANQTYAVTITNKSNAVRSGFQLTVLDVSNKFIGTLIKGTNVNIAKDNSNGRTYARQSAAVFLVNGEASWSFQWKAPASASNENLTFYFTSMCANGDGNNTKDNSIKNTKRVIFQLPVGNSDLNANLSVITSIREGKVVFTDSQNRTIEDASMFDLNGIRLLHSTTLPNNIWDLPNSIHGIYLLQFTLGHETHSEKIFIP